MFGRCSIGFERLADFVLGQLEKEESAQLEAHLQSGCARCERELAWLRRVVAAMQADDSVEPPAWVHRRAVSLFSLRYPPPAPSVPILRRIAAVLVFDSRQAVPLVGMRTGALTSRQMLYNAADLDVDLHIEPGEREAEFTLMGQILPSSGELARVAGAEVHLLRGHQRLLSKATDSFGEFVFGRLCPGKYALRIRLRDEEIDLVGINM